MAITHIAQTFSADPFLKVTEFDTVSLAATPMTIFPKIVSRPSQVKFTQDQQGIVVVTDRIAAGVSEIGTNPFPAIGNLTMSEDGSTVVARSTGVGGGSRFDVYRRVGSTYTLHTANIGTGDGYNQVEISPDGTIIALGGDKIAIYKVVGVTLPLEYTYNGAISSMKMVGDRLLFANMPTSSPLSFSSSSQITQIRLIGGYTLTSVASFTVNVEGPNIIFDLRKAAVSPDGKVVAFVAEQGEYPNTVNVRQSASMISLFKNAGTGNFAKASQLLLNTGSPPKKFSYSNARFSLSGTILAVVFFLQDTTSAIFRQYSVNTGTGVITAASSTNIGGPISLATVEDGYITGPAFSSISGAEEDIAFMSFYGIGNYKITWDAGTDRFVVSAAGAGGPFTGATTRRQWISHTQVLLHRTTANDIVAYDISGAAPVLDTASVPDFDEDDFTLTSVTDFVLSGDQTKIAYSRTVAGVQTLYMGAFGAVSPLGTFISYYEKSGSTYSRAGLVEHPAGYGVKGIAFRGVVGDAVSYFLYDGPDDAIEGRYICDGSNGTSRVLNPTGQVLDPAMENTFIEYAWDDYFVANFDYSDARPSTLKLYQFDSLAMDFTEKFSLETPFGPVSLSNCWDIIVANGPANNPFTLYKRVGDTIVQQPPLPIAWFTQYGTVVDLVSLEDCSGFIVVTDEDIVIVVEVVPQDPEDPESPPDELIVKDLVELYPEPVDPELVDPTEPLPPVDKPTEPPEEITLDPETGKIVISYPPNPAQPAPAPGGPAPGNPSYPIYPPTPVEVPVGTPGHPEYTTEFPPPPILGVDGSAGGGGLDFIKRTARVSVNVAFER